MAALVGSRAAKNTNEEILSLATPLNQLPTSETWVKEGTLEKQVVVSNIFWKERRCCLTKEYVAITRPDSLDILEIIPLREIEACDTPLSFQNDMSISSMSASFKGVQRSVSSDLEVGGGKLFGTRNLFGDGQETTDSSSTIFQIRTLNAGYNSGRTYSFRATSCDSAAEWVRAIKVARAELAGTKVVRTPYEVLQFTAQRIMSYKLVQWIMEGAIVANFILSVINTQVLPAEDSTLHSSLEISDWVFLVLFTVELVLNILSHGFIPFWHNGWNVVDAFVVAISLISKTLDDVPNLSVLRLVRVFRVVRLFNKLRSLKSIIESLSAAVLPVCHAFVLLFLVSAMYAVIGVHLYKDRRPVNFGNFSAALFTMFQVCTGDGWATTVVRPMFGSTGEEHPDGWVTLFFVSYILIVGTFLINVVVAVLLDEFLSAMDRRKREYSRAAEAAILEAASRQSAGALDPLLVTFSGFNTAADLSNRIRKVYQVLDADDSGGLNYDEMKAGMRRLRTEKPVHLSAEDWDVMTEGRTLCDDQGELNIEAFEIVIRRQLKLLVQRHMAIRMSQAELHDPTSASILFVLKQMMLTLNEVEDFIAPECTPDKPTHSYSRTPNHAGAGHQRGVISAQRQTLRGGLVELEKKLDSRLGDIGLKLDALVASLHAVVGEDGLARRRAGDDNRRSRVASEGNRASLPEGNGEIRLSTGVDVEPAHAKNELEVTSRERQGRIGSRRLPRVVDRDRDGSMEITAEARGDGRQQTIAEKIAEGLESHASSEREMAAATAASVQVEVSDADPVSTVTSPQVLRSPAPPPRSQRPSLKPSASLPVAGSVSSDVGFLDPNTCGPPADGETFTKSGNTTPEPSKPPHRHSLSGPDQLMALPGDGHEPHGSGISQQDSPSRSTMFTAIRQFGQTAMTLGSNWGGGTGSGGSGASSARNSSGRSYAGSELLMGAAVGDGYDRYSGTGNRATRMGRFRMA